MSKTKSTRKVQTTKTFEYAKGDTTLNFSLQTDNSSQLRDFKSILSMAIEDIDEILSDMKN